MVELCRANQTEEAHPMIHEYRLTAEDVRQQTMNTLIGNISLSANGYRCTTEMILDVILKASAARSDGEGEQKPI
jgi:hypothetical protein